MENQTLKIWFNAGEPSGDLQAASLLRVLKQLNPQVTAQGMGGAALAAAGQENLLSSNELSVMGLSEVISVIPRAWRLLQRIKAYLQANPPDLIILVDAPDFNFRVAKIAKSLNIPIYYFIPPKIWAWRTGRVKFIQQYVDKIFCILPFEVEFYAKHGIQACYVGNPLLDSLISQNSEQALAKTPSQNYIGILPGSRRKEILALLPIFCQTALMLQAQDPTLRFYCFKADNLTQNWLQSFIPPELNLEFVTGTNKYLKMQQCQAVLAASGTVILELGLLGIPTVVAYQVSKISAWLGQFLIKVPFVSLPNLILGYQIFPELLQDKVNPKNLATHLQALLQQDSQTWITNFTKLRQLCQGPNSQPAANFAAQQILESYAQK